MSNWYNYAEFIEFEGLYDPKYLNLDENDKDAWKVYAEKVRELMAKGTNLETY